MKILHTADWHLGQTFFEYDRKWEHQQFLFWLKDRVRELSPDLLLISGDVFDSPNPSAVSQNLYYTFLRDVTSENPQLQVIIIAGNHDSAARLEAPNPLLEGMNVMVRGTIRKGADGNIDTDSLIIPVVVDGRTEAYCLAVPYLRQGDYPLAESYGQGIQSVYLCLLDKIKNEGKPVIAMGHLQATGSEISENDRSERTIIGGLECVPPDVFDGSVLYTALGHLHRSQRVSGRENVRYAGAPIPMSFAEKKNKQGIVYIESEGENVRIEKIVYDSPVKLLSIPERPLPLEEVLEIISDLPDGEVTSVSPYLEIKIKMNGPEPSYKYKIEESLKGKSVRLGRIDAVMPLREESGIMTRTYEDLQTLKPLEVALDIYKRRYGGEEMPENMKRLLMKVIGEAGL